MFSLSKLKKSLSGGTSFKGVDIYGQDDKKYSLSDGPMRKLGVVAYGDTSYQVNNYLVNQSIILLPNHLLLWNAKTINDITIDSLKVFEYIHPRLEVLLIGSGKEMKQLSPEIIQYFKSKGIVVEISSSKNAATTFNVMSLDGRVVAAALLTMENNWVKQEDINKEFK